MLTCDDEYEFEQQLQVEDAGAAAVGAPGVEGATGEANAALCPLDAARF